MTPAVTPAELWRRIGSPRRAVAVVAHPDDESFGLGAVLSGLVDAGTSVSVVCFTRGGASTLGASADLRRRRNGEFHAAAAALAVDDVALFDYPDGLLDTVDHDVLRGLVDPRVQEADLVVAFEPAGVTGHPDHRAATAVARSVAADRHLPLLEWGVTPVVARALRAELGVPRTLRPRAVGVGRGPSTLRRGDPSWSTWTTQRRLFSTATQRPPAEEASGCPSPSSTRS